ncbi:hypothetical protein KAI11_04380 [Candidatus Bathyarchaeota archaeon]|nr:hypothetical protein [Candidatus Bathyarchaeota archaeon]
MVYCSKCGKQNDEAGEFCVDCGASLSSEKIERGRKEEGCFGLPGGGAIFGLFIGIIIIIVGLQQVLGFSIDVGPFAIIIVGLLFIAGAIYGFTRRGR